MEHEFKMVRLHDAPDLIEETARLMNSEWPRSLEARCHVIGNSSDDLPCSFLLLKVTTDSNVQAVVGHSRLTKVLQKPMSVLVESVIVDKTLRGCGLGKMIMSHTEEFALKHGYEMIHLSTHDKQSFYEHIGYSLSTPVSPVTKVTRFLSNSYSQIKKADDSAHCEKGTTMNNESDLQTRETAHPFNSFTTQTVPVLSIPPPPPLPSTETSQKTPKKKRGSKVYTWMGKHLYGLGNPL